MNPGLRDTFVRIGWRSVVALPFFVGGFWLLCLGLGGAFFGAALIILGGCILAFPVSELFSHPLTSLYYPSGSERPGPNFSIPEAHVKQGKYEQALAEYRAIAAAHPDELKAWLGIVEVSWRYRQDEAAANAGYREGMSKLTRDADRAALHRVYMGVRTLPR